MTISTPRANTTPKMKDWNDFASGPQHTMHLSDQDLIDLYKKRIQEYCDFFNENFLPTIIDSFKDLAKSVECYDLPTNILHAIESRDFSDFEIHSYHFQYIKVISHTKIGAFNRLNRRNGMSMDIDNITDFANFDINNKRLSMPTFQINPYFMRTDFQQYVNNTAGHELAHAIVHFYYDSIMNGMRYAKNIPLRRHLPHGKTWKSIARALGVRDKATSHNSTLNTENILILNEYYEKSTNSIKAKNKRTLKRFIYTCECKDIEHKLSTRRHNQFQDRNHLICSRCNKEIQFTGNVLKI